MNYDEFTTIVALDERHFYEFFYTFQTWEKFKPEIVNAPLIIIYDSTQINFDNYLGMEEKHIKFLDNILKRKNIKLIPWNPKEGLYKDQREKMLTSFFFATTQVKTKWFLKIDTDCLASNFDKNWLNNDFFQKDPVFIASGWSYTKPNNTFDIMDDWGDNQFLLNSYPRLNLPYDKNSDLVRCDRIISFVYFGLTDWTKQMMTMCEKDGSFKLPFPSQDTFMWYCAARRKEFFRRIKYKKYGFEHWHSFGTIKNRCLEVLK